MPQLRQYPEVTSTQTTDAIWLDRIGVGTVWVPAADFGPGGGGATGFDTLALFRAATIPPTVNTVAVGGYRTVNDGGAMVLGRTSAAGPGIWQSADGAFWKITNNEPNVLMLGAYNDGGSHQINSADIAANPQWIGSYSVGTEWNSVAGQELVYTCLAVNSVTGTVHWNSVSGGLNRPFNIAPGGTYVSNQTILIVAQGFYMRGNARLSCVWLWNGSPTVPLFYFNSGSYCTIERLGFSDNVAANNLIVMDHTSSPGGLATQQVSFRDCNFFGGGSVWTNIIFDENPVSGGAGQGDTILFENCLFLGSAIANVQLVGANTLSIIFLGGDQQVAFTDGYALYSSSAFVYGTSFQNSAVDYYHMMPSMPQQAQGGADFHSYGGAGGTELNTMRDTRSENLVPMLCATQNGRADCVTIGGSIMATAWAAANHYPLGMIICGGTVGTKSHYFMLVDDGGPDYFVGDVSGSTTTAVNLSATWTTNQWANFVAWERFTSGQALATNVTSNTATVATVSPAFGATTANRYIKIGGLSGGSAPNFDGASGHSTPPIPGASQGFTTTANSNTVTVGSDVTPINVGDYIVVPGAWSLTQAGFTIVSALIAKVTAIGGGGTTLTVSRNATIAVTNAPGYFGTGLTDNNLTWLDLDSDAFSGLIKADACFSPFGRARQCGPMDAMTMGRADWWRTSDVASNPATTNFNSRTYSGSNEPSTVITQGAGTLSLAQYISNGPLLSVNVSASCTFSWPTESIGVQSFEINATTTGAVTITMSGAWKGPSTVSISGAGVTHISAQWDTNVGDWVFRGSNGPY